MSISMDSKNTSMDCSISTNSQAIRAKEVVIV